MLFNGQEEYQMDDRRRVPIPPRFREAFATGHYLAAGVAGDHEWVELVTEDVFARLEALAYSWPETGSGAQARADFFGLSHGPDKKDGQGRVTLTDELVTYAGLSSEPGRKVVMVGAGDRLQIWDRDRWHASRADRRAAREAVMDAAAARRDRGGA